MGGRPKLLFVINDPAFFISHRLPIARAAKEHGLEVHVAAPNEDCVRRIEDEGFVFHSIRLSKHGTSLIGEIRTFLVVYKLFRRTKPSLVHLVTIKPVLYGGVAARLAGVPALVSAVTGLGILFVSNSKRYRLLRLCAKLIYRIAFGHKNQAVIFQNPDDRFFCVESAIVAENKTVLIKGSGVDMQHFSPGSSREGVPLVLLAGRMLWEKGVGDFVEAARLIKGYGVAARFVLVGSSVFWNSSSVGDDQLKDWHEEGVIEWWGQRADMAEVFSQTDVVCLPSAYGEGVPKFLIEAAACGKPIVTTDTPGCREIVQDGMNGILVPVKNPKAVAKAIGRLLNDPELREQMGRRGRAIAVDGFDVERVVRETLSVYRQLLAEFEVSN
jgi:glycosyltransferase involved in cell wall biosynthesis